MARSKEQDRATVIAQALARGMTISQISGVMGISKRTVTRVSSSLKKHGTPKPPPSGAKQGRPAKVTRAQAQAMLAWITQSDYSFYIKDLVDFLKSHHGYKGCDGTIRRALIRAGFKRQEPYRKSEVTHWIPPNHAVNFVVIAEDVDEPAEAEHPEAEQAELDSDHASRPDTPEPQESPAAATAVTQQTEPEAAPAPAPDAGSGGREPQPSQDSRLDPALRGEPGAGQPKASTSTPAAKRKRGAARSDGALSQQVDDLQSQVERQNEVIKQLQRQLAQSQAQNGMAASPAQPAQSAQPPEERRALWPAD